MEKDEIIQALADAVLNMDEDEAARLATEYIEKGYPAYEAIERGLSVGMFEAGKLFEEEEYFIPELLICADAMDGALEILKPHLEKKETSNQAMVVLGVVEGDTHDIGKNLVKIMLETSGYQVIDLGRDIPPEKFVAAAQSHNASVIALATLMTTTMDGMAEVVRILEKNSLHERFPVIVGGGPVSPGFAKKIGADAYASSAADAVRIVADVVSQRSERIAV